MKFLRVAMTVFVLACLQACGPSSGFVAASYANPGADAGPSDFGSGSTASGPFTFAGGENLIAAAKEVIADSNANHSSETACSIYLRKVLVRAGYDVPSFVANEFHVVAQARMPGWNAHTFSMANDSAGRAQLKDFLNSKPDHTAFIGQWPRVNRSGHVAIIEKLGPNEFAIYQAQQGRATPHRAPTSVEALLYIRNQYGDRGTLRLFVQE